MSLLLKALKQLPAAEPNCADPPEIFQDKPRKEDSSSATTRWEPRETSATAVADTVPTSTAIPAPEELIAPLDLGPTWSVEMLDPSIEEYQAFTSLPEPTQIESSPIFEVRAASGLEAPAEKSRSSESDLLLPSIDRLESLKKMLLDLETAPPKESSEQEEASTASLRSEEVAAPVATEYRELADHLLARFPATKRVSLLLLDAGRTTADPAWLVPFAAALNLSLAKRGADNRSKPPARILIVDVASRQRELARQLGLEHHDGLTKLLAGNGNCDSAIIRTNHAHVDLLPYGEGNLTEENTAKLPSLWARLQERYAIILISGGTWAEHGDSRPGLFFPVANGVALCVELGATPQSVAMSTRQAVAATGANLIGCIVRGESVALS